MKTMKTKYMITASTAALALLLAGCSQTTEPEGGTSPSTKPTASASADSSASSSPVASESESESGSGESNDFEPVTTKPGPDASVDAAFETFQQLVAVSNKQMQAGDTSTEDLAKFAVGNELKSTLDSLKAIKEEKEKVSGEVEVEEISGYSASVIEGKKELDDHVVYLEVCNDTSEVEVTRANGKPGEKPELLRAVLNVQAQYDTKLGKWFISKTEFKDGGVPC
ncbi:hypothetical protein ACLQ8T_16695 (plasmid) [Glutamicibacter sp. FR1]|uniref:hypothetical protein n=1 Tax=Glutamicibacter sp. FR1 TaxID=3393744 RepID=UPI0039B10C05